MRWHPFSTPPSTWHPLLRRASFTARSAARYALASVERRAYASEYAGPLPIVLTRHQSVLIRRTAGADLALQRGKIVNLERALPTLDGLVLFPGEAFSFWRSVGPPTATRGFVPGLEFARGVPRPGVGGGLCALANLLHWMALHSPLDVLERHHHSLDVFPDDGRTVPFGSGATVVFRFLDYRVVNSTARPIQIRVWRTEQHLCGELRSSRASPEAFHVFERAHRFEVVRGQTLRRNELWRRVVDVETGHTVREEKLYDNSARVLYEVPRSQCSSPTDA